MPPLFGIDGDAGRFQPEIGDGGMPADREHHLVGGDAGSVRQMRGEFLAVLVDLADGAAGEDVDAVLLHLGADMGADILVKTAQDVVAAIDQRHVGAEAGEDAGEFQRDIAAALDHDALRQFGQVKHFVGRDHVLDAGNFGAVVGRAAGRDQHVFRGDGLAGREPQRVGVLEHRAGLDHAARRTFRRWWCRPSSRAISLSLLAIRVGQSKVAAGMVQPKPAASSISCWMCEAIDETAFSARSRGSRRCRPCGILRRSSPWRHGRRRSGRRARRPNLLRSRTDRRRTQPWSALASREWRVANGEWRADAAARLPFATRYSPSRSLRSPCRACASRRGIRR